MYVHAAKGSAIAKKAFKSLKMPPMRITEMRAFVVQCKLERNRLRAALDEEIAGQTLRDFY